MRRVLERHELLARGKQAVEIAGRDRCIDVMVISAQEENHRHIDGRHGMLQIEPQQLVVHRFERYVVAANEPRDFQTARRAATGTVVRVVAYRRCLTARQTEAYGPGVQRQAIR